MQKIVWIVEFLQSWSDCWALEDRHFMWKGKEVLSKILYNLIKVQRIYRKDDEKIGKIMKLRYS